jgi:hypothetical protein
VRASDYVVPATNTSDPTLYSLRSTQHAGVDAALGGVAPAAAAPAAAATPAKGRKKSTSAAAQQAAAEPVAAGDTAEEVLNFLGSLLKETEFISMEDPVHSSDFAALRLFPAVRSLTYTFGYSDLNLTALLNKFGFDSLFTE